MYSGLWLSLWLNFTFLCIVIFFRVLCGVDGGEGFCRGRVHRWRMVVAGGYCCWCFCRSLFVGLFAIICRCGPPGLPRRLLGILVLMFCGSACSIYFFILSYWRAISVGSPLFMLSSQEQKGEFSRSTAQAMKHYKIGTAPDRSFPNRTPSANCHQPQRNAAAGIGSS